MNRLTCQAVVSKRIKTGPR